jgi:hypothetical protein
MAGISIAWLSTFTWSLSFGSLGISVVVSICWGKKLVFAQNRPHIWGVPRQIPKSLSFSQ